MEDILTTITYIKVPDQVKMFGFDYKDNKYKSLLMPNCNPQRLNVRCLYIQIESIIGILRNYRNENKKCCYKIECCKHSTNSDSQKRCNRCLTNYVKIDFNVSSSDLIY